MTSAYRYKDEAREHLHLFEDKPLTGASSVVQVLAKPLTWWASGLAVEKFGYINEKKGTEKEREAAAKKMLDKLQGMPLNDYRVLLECAYRAHAETLKEKADAGTDLHEELEKYVDFHMEAKSDDDDRGGYCYGLDSYVYRDDFDAQKFPTKIQPFIEWAEQHVERFLWSEMHCFSEKAWTGGISDAGCELKDGTVAIIDFKSAKEAYPSHFIQIGGYDLMISANGGYKPTGEKIFTLPRPITKHIVVPFGAKNPLPVVSTEVETNKEAFKACLLLYRMVNKMQEQ